MQSQHSRRKFLHDLGIGAAALPFVLNLSSFGLASEQKGDFQAAAAAFQTLVTRYPDSQLAVDAKAALQRVKGRLESPK